MDRGRRPDLGSPPWGVSVKETRKSRWGGGSLGGWRVSGSRRECRWVPRSWGLTKSSSRGGDGRQIRGTAGLEAESKPRSLLLLPEEGSGS